MITGDNPSNKHRHLSHLLAVYPGRQIIAGRDAALAKAAAVSLDARGDGGTGWAAPWKMCLWARLRNGERAYLNLREKFHPVLTTPGSITEGIDGSSPNLFNIVWGVMQLDGNYGFPNAVAEMLLQSHAGEIDLLPALPAAWPKGRINGLRARGGITVDLAWADRKLRSAELRASTEEPFRIRAAGPVTIARPSAAAESNNMPHPVVTVSMAPAASGRSAILETSDNLRDWREITTIRHTPDDSGRYFRLRLTTGG
jgi:alpha-L-fucosidase 2